MLVAQVAIDGATGAFDKLYSYRIPTAFISTAKAGIRVTVPFGRGNLTKQGIIFKIIETEENEKIKEISFLTDEKPILSDEMLKLCEHLKSNVFCTYFDAVHTVLPAGLNYKLKNFYSANDEFVAYSALEENEKIIFDFLRENGETPSSKIEKSFENCQELLLSLCEKQAILHNTMPVRRANDFTRKWVRLNDNLLNSPKLTARQKEIIDVVEISGEVSIKELQYFTGASLSVIENLNKKGILEVFEKQEFRIPYKLSDNRKTEDIALTDEQQKAFDGLLSDFNADDSKTALLYGVTGSGKTQVFLKLIDIALKENKGVIFMVPEIALTPQMIKIFSDRYGEKIAVFHSGLSLGQRMDEYNRIKNGRAKIALGTRSAVFAPFDNLGLIIIDEEQEHTYKSEKSPRFHTRDVARFRVNYNKCLLCLSSATPSVESFSAAKDGRYSLYSIKNRYGNAVLPDVVLVDMKKELSDGNSSDISRELAKRIEEQLALKKQIIILLNRRGHNTYVSCRECGHVFSCSDCSISLTYHSANKRLMCHYCGKSEPLPSECPECGAKYLSFSGVGTQRLEEQIKMLFKDARVLRLDADSTMTKDAYSVKLNAFSNGEYDIMIGTQMVAKGLDFKNVTLVGVIGADKALYSDDYRGYERTFSLLTQVVGRAGRAEDAGVAVIQTSDTESPIIKLAAKQDYDGFYNTEINTRKLMIFPPFCDLCQITTQSMDQNLSKSAIKEIFDNIKSYVSDEYKDVKIIILGPISAAVLKVGGKYRYRMLIKCKNSSRFRQMINNATDIKRIRDLSVGIDVNPENII